MCMEYWPRGTKYDWHANTNTDLCYSAFGYHTAASHNQMVVCDYFSTFNNKLLILPLSHSPHTTATDHHTHKLWVYTAVMNADSESWTRASIRPSVTHRSRAQLSNSVSMTSTGLHVHLFSISYPIFILHQTILLLHITASNASKRAESKLLLVVVALCV